MDRRRVKGIAPILALVCAATVFAFVLLSSGTDESATELNARDEHPIELRLVPNRATLNSDAGTIAIIDSNPTNDATPAVAAGSSGSETKLDWAPGTYTGMRAGTLLTISLGPSTYFRANLWGGSTEFEGNLVESTEGLDFDATHMSDVWPNEYLFVPIRRARCRYLVAVFDLQEALERWLTPRDSTDDDLPGVLQWSSNEQSKCAGTPELPEFYRRSVIEGIEGNVIHDPFVAHLPDDRVLIDRTWTNGVWIGLRMRDASSPRSEWSARVAFTSSSRSVLVLDAPTGDIPEHWTSAPRR